MFLQVSQSAGYAVCIILGLSFLIPIGLHLNAFKGHCLLYSGGNYSDDGDFVPYWASPLYCIFTVAVGVVSVIVAIIQLTRSIMMLVAGTDSSFRSSFVETVVSILIVLIILADAIIVSAGFAFWCSKVEERFSKGCEAAAAGMKINQAITNQTIIERKPIRNDTPIDASGFFLDMETVQFSVWSALVSWVFILTVCGRKLFIHHESDNLMVSMARERRRYNQQSSPPDLLDF